MVSYLSLKNPPRKIQGEILIPGSKSESNRALILKALTKGAISIHNLSYADDTVCMEKLLKAVDQRPNSGEEITLDVGPAGTVMRFLTAFLSLQAGSFVLTGSSRMLERPIQILVEALVQLGAEIEYLGKEGYPPIRIHGKPWEGKRIRIPANISSQYISALLLIAPFTPQGLEIEMEGELTSAPYVEMTLEMMESIGIQVERKKGAWKIPAQSIQAGEIKIEPDWSGASYWFSMAALAPEIDLCLLGLQEKSLQADRKIVEIMKDFGVQTRFEKNGIYLSKRAHFQYPKALNFKTCPDIAQTLIACGAGLNLDLLCTGLETLKIKETDRVEAMKQELEKIGVRIESTDSQAHLLPKIGEFPKSMVFMTYHDHRMAMALAPLVYRIEEVKIENPEVVGKSYPSFWEDLKKLGFIIE